MIKNIFLLIFSLVLSIALGIVLIESIAIGKSGHHQNWHDPNTKFDSQLGWSPIVNRKITVSEWGTLSSNSHGFRSEEVDQSKDQILILGDSVAWGYGVSNQETVSYFLQEKLESSDFQVSNLGVPGYGLGQVYLYLEKQLQKLNSVKSILLIICTGTDFEDTQSNIAYWKKKPYFYLKNGAINLDQKKIFKYDFANLFSISRFLIKLATIHPKIDRFLLSLRGEKISPKEDMPYIAAQLLSRINGLAQNKGAEFKVVLAPEKKGIRDENEYYLWFKKLVNSQGYDSLDFKELLMRKSQTDDYYVDNYHFTAKGNAYLAETIFKRWFA